MTISERFGVGIPDTIDATVSKGGFDTWDFYFIKDNLVYKSVEADEYQGAMGVGFPLPVHDEFPVFPCGEIAVTDGQNAGGFIIFKGTKHYQVQNGNLVERGTMCG